MGQTKGWGKLLRWRLMEMVGGLVEVRKMQYLAWVCILCWASGKMIVCASSSKNPLKVI